MSLTTETWQNSKVSFLDVNVIVEQGKFTTNDLGNQLVVVYKPILIASQNLANLTTLPST